MLKIKLSERLLCWWLTLARYAWWEKTAYRNKAFEMTTNRSQEPWVFAYSLKGRGTFDGKCSSRRHFEQHWYTDRIEVYFDEVYVGHAYEPCNVKNLELQYKRPISLLRLIGSFSPIKWEHLKVLASLLGLVFPIALVAIPANLMITYIPLDAALQAGGWWLMSLLGGWLFYKMLFSF